MEVVAMVINSIYQVPSSDYSSQQIGDAGQINIGSMMRV